MSAPPHKQISRHRSEYLQTMATISSPPQAEIWERMFPQPNALKCPQCSSCIWSETLYVRHVRQHYPTPPKETWKCSVCGVTADSKPAIAHHYRSHHQNSPQVRAKNHSPTSTNSSTTENSPPWAHLQILLISKTGLRNHERARHQPQVSTTLSREAASAPVKPAKPPPAKWSEEIARFLTAVNRFGLRQTALIMKAIGTRSYSQVASFKTRYKTKHPIWAMTQHLPSIVQTSNQGTQTSPSGSPGRSPHQSTLTESPAPSQERGPYSQGPRLATVEEVTPVSSPDHPSPQQTTTPSLHIQATLQMADQALRLLRGQPSTTSLLESATGGPPTVTSPLPPTAHPATLETLLGPTQHTPQRRSAPLLHVTAWTQQRETFKTAPRHPAPYP